MTRVNNRKGSLMRTPDVTCQCGHRDISHTPETFFDETGTELVGDTWLSCDFCDCEGFVPRDRSIPSQPVQFYGSHGVMPYHPKQVARKNEDAT